MVAEGVVISITCTELTRQIQTNTVQAGKTKPGGVIETLSLETKCTVFRPQKTQAMSASDKATRCSSPSLAELLSVLPQGRWAGNRPQSA